MASDPASSRVATDSPLYRARRAGRLARKLRTETGRRALADAMLSRIFGSEPDLVSSAFLHPDDLASRADAFTVPPPAAKSGPLQIAWVSTPPSPGSGGHTTMFRMVEALERAGHSCSVVLYDPHGVELNHFISVIRKAWPSIRADVRTTADGLRSIDTIVATGWSTAHVIHRNYKEPAHRLYFVQDYEPYFYARGSTYALAEESYCLGFSHIALGLMVAQCLQREVGVQPVAVLPFGCDTEVYHILSDRPRSGVVFYARPGAERRGYLLSRLALQRFHARCPDQPIHAYGNDRRPDLPFDAVWHGRLSPQELNVLYNSAVAGVAMSFTNISLTAEEMLAAGVIPIVNDSPLARADLSHPLVAWTTPTPDAIASRLEELLSADAADERALHASTLVRQGWDPAQIGMVTAVEAVAAGLSHTE